MPLKAVVPDLDGVAEPLREHYKEQNGVYVLGIDGFDDHPSVKNLKSAHDRTKAENGTLKTTVAEQKGKIEALGDITPEDLDQLRKDATEKGKKPTGEELDALVTQRFSVVKARLEKQVETLEAAVKEKDTALTSTSGKLSEVTISSALKDAAAAKNVRPKAIQIVTDMAKTVWRLGEDGVPVAMKGDQPISGAHGPISMEEWVESLAADHDYLFEPNKGGGSGGGERQKTTGKPLDLNQPNAIGANLEKIAKGEITSFRS